MIDFAQPLYLGLLVVVATMVYAAWRLNRWRANARRDFAGPQVQRWPAPAFWSRTLLLLAAAMLVAFAAARPQWGKTERVRELEGVDLVIALDISKSMEAADVQPNRLAVAQEQLVRLVEAERGSRIGLVFFAGSAFLRSPLTSDTQAMTQLINRAGQEIGLTRVGSDLGAPLDVAAVILAAGDENRGKAVILVSDGEDFAGTYAAKAADLQAKGIAVHTVGVGTPQGAPLFDRTANGSQVPHLDASGRSVITRLNPDSLQAIAAAGDGNYRLLGLASDSLLDVRTDLRRLAPTPTGDERQIIPIERFQLFVAAALVLLVLSWFLPGRLPLPALARARRPHPGLALLLVAFFVGACGSSDSLSDQNREANRLYDSGDFEGALSAYQELLAERPDVDELSYNAGNALHRLENYERAIAETQRGLPPNEVGLGVATYFSLGNHLLQLGRFEEAYAAYRAALLLDPTDADSKYNLELALLALGADIQPGDQGQGEGTPQPGEGTPQPGAGTPQAGNGTPQAGGTPDAGSSPQPGAGSGTPNPTPGNAQSLQRTLEEALAGIDDELTYEEAIAILDLLRQQQQTPRGPNSVPTGPDY